MSDQPEITFVVLHEILPSRQQPAISISVYDPAVGHYREFMVTEYDQVYAGNGRPIRVAVYDESFIVFRLIPEFFDELAGGNVITLHDVFVLLAALGAVDKTPKVEPIARRRERLKAMITHRLAESVGYVPPDSRADVADLVLDAIGERDDD